MHHRDHLDEVVCPASRRTPARSEATQMASERTQSEKRISGAGGNRMLVPCSSSPSYIYIQICTHVYIYIYCGALSFMKHHRITNPSMSSFLSSHPVVAPFCLPFTNLRLEPLCLQTVTCHFPVDPSQTQPDVRGASQVATR